MRVTMEAGALPRPVTFTGSGYQNLRTRSGRLKLDMSDLSDVSNGEVPTNASVEEIVVWPVIYMRGQMFAGAIPPGRWGKIDLQASGKQMGFDFNSLTQSDPTQSLRYLRVAGEDVKRVGTENVRGIPTTHYTATMDMRKTADALPEGPKRDAARKSIDRVIDLTGVDKYPVAVWIDRRKLVRRMSFTMDMKVQGQKMKMTMSMDLFNFGPKPKVKPPADDEVVDLPGSGAQTSP